MKRIEIEALSESSNCPVVKMPGRKYPGVVLQGDSLKILLDLAEEVRELCERMQNTELSETATALTEKLAAYVNSYEQAMRASGLELPYPKPK